MYEFTMEDLAHYTGRSLATFKRDFKKISDLTPEKWLIRKRLEVAYNLMKEGGNKVVDVYTKVGFRNQSHFSAAFKSSTALRRRRLPPLYSYLWIIYSLFLWIFHGKALSLQHNKTDICI